MALFDRDFADLPVSKPMAAFERTVVIARPAADAWAVLTDLDQASSLMPDVVRIERLTDGPFGEGTRWNETRRMGKREGSSEIRVTAFDAGRMYATVSEMGPVWARYTFTVDPVDEGRCRVTLVGEAKLASILGIFNRLFLRMMEKADGDLLANLKKVVEADVAEPSSG